MSFDERKFVIVGDGESGKTCLLRVFFEDVYPDVYVPTTFDYFTTVVEVDRKKVKLSLWDTAGQEDYDRLRPLSYPNTDAVIICYSIDAPESLANVTEKWLPEVRFFCKDVPVILVGNKKDLRDQRTSGHQNGTAGTDEPSAIVPGWTRMDVDDDDEERTTTTDCRERTGNAPSRSLLVKEEGQTVASEIGAFAFFECSAKTKEGVRDVFMAAVRATNNNKQCVLL